MQHIILVATPDLVFFKIIETVACYRIPTVNFVLCETKEQLDRCLNNSSVSMLILDPSFSELPGFQLLYYLRSEKLFKKEIWFFADIHTEEYTRQAYVLGDSKVVCRPFDPYVTVNKISRLLGL